MTVPAEDAGLAALVGEERVGVTQADGLVAGAGGVNVGRHLILQHFHHLSANGRSLRKIVL